LDMKGEEEYLSHCTMKDKRSWELVPCLKAISPWPAMTSRSTCSLIVAARGRVSSSWKDLGERMSTWEKEKSVFFVRLPTCLPPVPLHPLHPSLPPSALPHPSLPHPSLIPPSSLPSLPCPSIVPP
jgi:hypothetical protein